MWKPDQIWQRWKQTTRLCVGLDAASESFVGECKAKRESGELGPHLRIKWRGRSDFEAPLDEMLVLLSDKTHLARMLLVHSYVITESVAAYALGHIGESRNLVSTGVESWSSLLLSRLNMSWDRFQWGKLGLMEACFARNAIVHGLNCYSIIEMKRCQTAAVTPSWNVGDRIPLELDALLELRFRLQCFIRILCQEIKAG
jgi:hypothetical protein